MDKFKGTQGPWTVKKNWAGESVAVIYSNGCSIAFMSSVTSRTMPIEQEHANAQLIASAPELLEALQDACECLEILASKLGCQTQSAALKSDAESFGALEILDRSRDIINKALGKEQSNG